MKNQRGITLIALVITIVVMLILAGITVNVMLTDGVVSKSAGAQKEGNKQAERERLAVYIQGHFLNNYSNHTEEMDLASISPSIIELSNESGKESVKSNINSVVYGDGYLYIPSGSTIKNFGTVEFSYVLNENTGDLFALDPVEYSKVTNE